MNANDISRKEVKKGTNYDIREEQHEYVNDMQSEFFNMEENEDKRKLEKTLRYWNNIFTTIMRQDSVIFAAVKNDKIIKTDMVSLLRKLISLNILDKLEEIVNLPHNAFVYLKFESGQDAALFQNNVDKIDDAKLNYVQFNKNQDICTISIDNIPPIDVKELLPDILKSYGEVINISPTKLILPNKKIIITAPTNIEFKLKQDKSINDLPPFIMFGLIKAYMNVRGKKNICFNCGKDDHLAKECRMRYCKSCKVMKDERHTCSNSYADKVKINPHKFIDILTKATQEDYPEINKEHLIIKETNKGECNKSQTKSFQETENVMDMNPTIIKDKMIENITKNNSNENSMTTHLKDKKRREQEGINKDNEQVLENDNQVKLKNSEKINDNDNKEKENKKRKEDKPQLKEKEKKKRNENSVSNTRAYLREEKRIKNETKIQEQSKRDDEACSFKSSEDDEGELLMDIEGAENN